MNASSSFPPYARDASLSNLKTGPAMLTPSSQRTALPRRPFLLLRRSCPPTNVLSPTARPLLCGAAHPDPCRAAAPGTTASRPYGAEPQRGWPQASSLAGLASTSSPGWMLFPGSSQHPEHNLLILFLQFLCASVVSAKGFYIFNNVSPKRQGASF